MEKYCLHCMEPLTNGRCENGCVPNLNSEDARVLRPGTVLQDRYLIGEVLGQGGFGITYIGRDLTLDIRVAIKEYFPTWMVVRDVSVSSQVRVTSLKMVSSLSQGHEKFLKEARILARFRAEKGIVEVLDFFRENNTAYIVMEYIDGQTLQKYLKKSRTIPPNKLFPLMMPVMKSLDRLHKAGLIHRDISPDNIMLTTNGRVKLLDFGTVRSANMEGDNSMTVMLKHGYAPEEQYYRNGRQGPWTDVYALSATMYKCITGIIPADSLERRVQDSVQPPSQLGIPITPAQEAALMKGMAYSSENRFRSVGELAAALSSEIAKSVTLPGMDYAPPTELMDTHSVQPAAPRTDNVLRGDRPFNLDRKPYRVFGSDYTRNKIHAITFLDTLEDRPDNAWDVSEARDGSVMAWVDSDSCLFIGGEGGVAAPDDCSHMFAGYESVSSILFNGKFDTADVTNMCSMFEGCSSMETLDLNGFDTSHVTDMSCLFYECRSIKTLDLGSFNTGDVTDMWYMFKGCSSIKTLDLTSFNTRRVAEMEGMFYGCKKLTKLHVRNWNISKVNTKYIFFDCSLTPKIVSAILSGNTVST